MRHKEIHGMNVQTTIKFALDFGMALISEKIRKRVKLYTNFKSVQIDMNLLPKEYGGTMPMEEMISKHSTYFSFIIRYFSKKLKNNYYNSRTVES